MNIIKITKTEKRWLIAVILFYACYNLPFFPVYGDAEMTIIHAIATLIPLWISVYVGFFKICKIYKLKEKPSTESATLSAENKAPSKIRPLYDLASEDLAC